MMKIMYIIISLDFRVRIALYVIEYVRTVLLRTVYTIMRREKKIEQNE
jgi:hypothetical protein